MEKLFKKYFVLVAENPLIAVLWLIFLPAALICLTFAVVFKNNANFQLLLLNDIPSWIFRTMIFFLALNIIVPLFFMTYFYKMKKRIVLVKPDGDKESAIIYSKPLWGKFPCVEIMFPEGWDLTDDSPSRQLELKIIFRINSKTLAFLSIKTKFYFNGNFQADDLEEMIRQQGNNAKDRTRINFTNCLQEIVIRFLLDRRELIDDDLKDWQQKKITTKDLEKKWFRPEIIFQNLFINVDRIEMTLNTPEIKKTREK